MFMKNISAISKYGYMYAHRNFENINITGSEHSVVIFLSMHDSVNQERISEALMLDKGTIAKTLAKLEEKDFIVRTINEKNRREKIISLTEHGKSIIDVILDTSEKWQNDVLQGFTPEEIDIFYKMIERIAQNAKMISQNNLSEE